MHGSGAAFDVARHAAGLALQVETQAQAMQMPKNLQRNAARSALGGLGKHQVTQLGKQGGGQAQQPVGHQQRRRHHQQGRHTDAAIGVHGVDQLFEQQRHTDIGHLGAHHEGQRRDHAPLVLPQVGEQAAQRSPVGARRVNGRRCGGAVGGGAEFARTAHG